MERHVAAGNVLRHDIGEQHVARPAGRGGDGSLHPVHRGRRNVRPADARVIAAEQRADHVVEPVGIGHAVGIGVGENVAGRRVRAGVARVAEAHVWLDDGDDSTRSGSPTGARERRVSTAGALRRRPLHDLLRVVLRSVIHEHDLVVRIVRARSSDSRQSLSVLPPL